MTVPKTPCEPRKAFVPGRVALYCPAPWLAAAPAGGMAAPLLPAPTFRPVPGPLAGLFQALAAIFQHFKCSSKHPGCEMSTPAPSSARSPGSAPANSEGPVRPGLDFDPGRQPLITVCSSCHKKRDAHGRWVEMEPGELQRAARQITHGLCPACAQRLYPDLYELCRRKKPFGGE